MNREAKKGAQYFSELISIFKRAGFNTLPVENGTLPVTFCGEPLCVATESGGIRYRPENINSIIKDEARNRVVSISATVAEYMTIMAGAPQLKACGLDEDFKLLAEYNGCILAAKDGTDGRGASFVTWERDFDGKGVHHGHYYENNYLGAKEDFAQRAGFVNKHRLFSDEQLTEIYRSVGEALDSGFERTASEEKALKDIQKQVEYALPDVQERLPSQEPTETQQLNM